MVDLNQLGRGTLVLCYYFGREKSLAQCATPPNRAVLVSEVVEHRSLPQANYKPTPFRRDFSSISAEPRCERRICCGQLQSSSDAEFAVASMFSQEV
jgi:hypothetical protein